MGTGICPWCGKKVDRLIMYRGDIVGCRYCGIHAKETNADRLRTMDTADLAALCAAPCPPDQQCGRNTVAPLPECRECWKRWLGSEVGE